MKYFLLTPLILFILAVASPGHAETSPSSESDQDCSTLCATMNVKSGIGKNLDPQSPQYNPNIQWDFKVIWKWNDPKARESEEKILKQQLEDNKALIVSLADALAQNKMIQARGFAILLAPRLNYSDPQKLMADMKTGIINIGRAPNDL
jgi:hypothetical protein